MKLTPGDPPLSVAVQGWTSAIPCPSEQLCEGRQSQCSLTMCSPELSQPEKAHLPGPKPWAATAMRPRTLDRQGQAGDPDPGSQTNLVGPRMRWALCSQLGPL